MPTSTGPRDHAERALLNKLETVVRMAILEDW